MLFAEAVVLSTEVLLAAVTGIVLALAGAVTMLFRLLQSIQDARLAEQKAQYEKQLVVQQAQAEKQAAEFIRQLNEKENETKSYKEISIEVTRHIETLANAKRAAEGKPPFKPVAPVVAEHSSPMTDEQKRAAELQTIRAQVVAASLILDLPAREQAPDETAEQRVERLVKEKLAVSPAVASAVVAGLPAPVLGDAKTGSEKATDAILDAERTKTDASLEAERAKTDKALEDERKLQ